MNTVSRSLSARLFTLVFLLLTAICQCGGVIPRFFGAGAFILVPACVCMAMFESDIGAVVFGLFVGALWDYSSAMPDGIITVFVMLSALLCSLSVRFIFRRNIVSSIVCCAGVLLAASLIFTLFSGVPAAEKIRLLAWFYIPSAFYSALFIPIYFYIFKALYRNRGYERVI